MDYELEYLSKLLEGYSGCKKIQELISFILHKRYIKEKLLND